MDALCCMVINKLDCLGDGCNPDRNCESCAEQNVVININDLVACTSDKNPCGAEGEVDAISTKIGNNISQNLKQQLLQSLGYSGENMHNIVLQLRNHRGCHIPVTIHNLKASSKRTPLSVTLTRRFVTVNSDISDPHIYDEKKKQLESSLHKYHSRLDSVEAEQTTLHQRRETYLQVRDVLFH